MSKRIRKTAELVILVRMMRTAIFSDNSYRLSRLMAEKSKILKHLQCLTECLEMLPNNSLTILADINIRFISACNISME